MMGIEKPLTRNGQVPASDPASKEPRLLYLDYFRGFAILMVVAAHAGNALIRRGVNADLTRFHLMKDLVDIGFYNSTFYFALISGCLYSYTLYRKPFGTFMATRIRNVWLPFALVSTLITIGVLQLGAMRTGIGLSFTEASKEVLLNLVTGDAWNNLWYVPVIMVIYLFSPALLKVVRDKRFRPMKIMVFLLPFVFPRIGTELTLSMLLYYVGVYAMGIAIGLDVENILKKCEAYRGVLVVAILALSAAIMIGDYYAANQPSPVWVMMREWLFCLQRLCISLAALLAFRQWAGHLEGHVGKGLLLLASYAFGIYFLHAPLLRPIAKFTGRFVLEYGTPAPNLALLCAITVSFVIGLTISVLLVHLTKLVTGRYSKYIIGS